MRSFDEHVKTSLNARLKALEDHFESDVIFFFGPIFPGVDKVFRNFIERLKIESGNQARITIFLNTGGGVAEYVEKLVEIVRFHYSEVYFVVPDYAMSAGTIFCMAGNKIFMDSSSSLGPIDPQVYVNNEPVPALGYLDQVERMIEKSRAGELTDAEYLIMQQLDLALLSQYEQAKNLTITLLKKWLAQFKFADWETHQTDIGKLNQPVTQEEKVERAEEIAAKLADNKLWHSHGRMIGIDKLKDKLRLKIDDYSHDTKLRSLVRNYNDFLVEYVKRQNIPFFLHSKNNF